MLIETVKDIDLDYLKSFRKRIYYFGLGFIQVKLSEVERLHFYSLELPAITEDIHNHRYDFLSRVFKGELTNHNFAVFSVNLENEQYAKHYVTNETCNPDIKAPSKPYPVWVPPTVGGAQTYKAGEGYVMSYSWYHRVEAKDCITHLVRTHYKQEYAQVVLEEGKEPVCPFSKNYPEDYLWRLVEKML